MHVLLRHEVAFVLIGGLAAVAHGSPLPTADVDITPRADRGNLERLSAALRELGAAVRVGEGESPILFDHDADSFARAGTWNLTTVAGDLDIAFVPAGTGGYEDLVREAKSTEALGSRFLIASLADVIRSKQAANRPKDQRALPVLREILARRQDEQ